MHVPKYLSMHKWFLDDLPRFGLKMWYLFLTTDKKSFMIPLSIGIGLASLIISFVSFVIATTSILSNKDLQKLKESGAILNFTKESQPKELQDEIDKKLENEFEHRLTLIKKLPRKTIDQKDERNKLFATFKMDYHNYFGSNKKIWNLDEVKEESNELFSDHDNNLTPIINQEENNNTNTNLNTKNECVTHEDVKVDLTRNNKNDISKIGNMFDSSREQIWHSNNLKDTKKNDSLDINQPVNKNPSKQNKILDHSNTKKRKFDPGKIFKGFDTKFVRNEKFNCDSR